ncbi:RNase H family protein [Sedimentitalea sp. XS_ASV28]|uniref:RNase H family protein n=1 Tax=Sedimentitalea sp. XS_ASV28 TaxID=3241296 RepID=UPI0035139C29
MLTPVVENHPHGALADYRGNLFVVLFMMLHPTQELEPPTNPGRFSDLWKRFENEAQKRRVKIVWVKGHAGDPNNERADKLAGQQAEEARLMAEADLIPDKS